MNFWKKLSWKKRLYYFLGGFALLVLMAYQFSFSNTMQLKSQIAKNKKTLQQAASAPQQIQNLEHQINMLNTQVNQAQYDRQVLFEAINSFCEVNSMTLRSFEEEQKRQQKDIEIITNEFAVEGKYTDLVKLAYELEFSKKLGHIASVSYDKTTDKRTKRSSLIATYFIQNVQHAKPN